MLGVSIVAGRKIQIVNPIDLDPIDFRLIPDSRGLPMLVIEFASGHVATIAYGTQKLNLVRMGLVFLGADIEDLVPPIFLPGETPPLAGSPSPQITAGS